ncbi:MAG: hypothetical protein WCP12_16595 [bacterium]
MTTKSQRRGKLNGSVRRCGLFLSIAWVGLLVDGTQAATWITAQNGSWDAWATWGGAGTPQSGDTADIRSNKTVTAASLGTLPALAQLTVGTVSTTLRGELDLSGTTALTATNTTFGTSALNGSRITIRDGAQFTGNVFTQYGSTTTVDNAAFSLSGNATPLIPNGGATFSLQNGGVVSLTPSGGYGVTFLTDNNKLMIGGKNTNGDRARFLVTGRPYFFLQSNSNAVTVTSGGTLECATLRLAYANNKGNVLSVTNGGLVKSSTVTVGYQSSSYNNRVIVSGRDGDGTPSTFDLLGGTVILCEEGSHTNSLIVEAGGLVTNGTVRIGNTGTQVLPGSNNLIKVQNGGVMAGINGLWLAHGAANNPICTNYYRNGLLVTGSGSLFRFQSGMDGLVGGGMGNNNENSIQIEEGGQMLGCRNFSIGTSATNLVGNYSNRVVVTGGGLLELSSSLVIGTAGRTDNGNHLACTNGGVLQFTTAAPTITINSLSNNLSLGNKVLVENGVLTYRGVSGVILTNNQATTGVGSFDWQGKNTLRFNNATGICANASTTYTIEDSGNPRNYVGLELVNGGTGISTGNITIGNTGSLLVSNTVAAFSGSLIVNGGIAICTDVANPTRVNVAGTLSLPATGTVNVSGTVTNSLVLFSYGTKGMIPSLQGWTLNRSSKTGMLSLKVDEAKMQVLLVISRGTLIRFF